MESFFKALNSQNEITTLISNSLGKLFAKLNYLVRVKEQEEKADRLAGELEKHRKTLLENKIPESHKEVQTRKEGRGKKLFSFGPSTSSHLVPKTDARLSCAFYEEEPAMRKKLNEVAENRKKWKDEGKPSIEKQIQEKEEELKNETEKLEKDVSTVIDKWAAKLHANDQGSISYTS